MRESEQVLLVQLGDVDVPAHRQIDERRSDVFHVGGIVDERAELGG